MYNALYFVSIDAILQESTWCRCKIGYTFFPCRQHPATRLRQTTTRRPLFEAVFFIIIIIIRKLYFCETECQPPSLIFSQIKVRIDLQLDPEFHMGEVRKIQKKLRQIENLEIKISLTPEEIFKVQKQIMCLSFVSLTPGSAIPVLICLTSHDCVFCFY